MDWTEIIITTKSSFTEDVSAISQMVALQGIYIEDYSEFEADVEKMTGIDLIEDELLKKDKTIARIHIYISPEDNYNEAVSFLTERLNAENIPFEVSTSAINEEDWANNWKKYYKPFPIGERLAIKPEWEHYDNNENRVVIETNPGVAFGTGTHESTQLCLMQIEKIVTPSCGKRILDIGCGSGILAIASLLLGADCATGIDIDPMAVKIAAENGELNKLYPPKLTIQKGNLVDKIPSGEKFDVIIANIIADVIIQLSGDVSRYMDNDAVFICSGIIDEKCEKVENALIMQGFTICDIIRLNSWVCITAQLSSTCPTKDVS